jgi:stearoyl-CoA desaturase (delta-9 desaturase)
MGELFQNNHHQYPTRPNFAVRWYELDPAYQVMRVLAWLGVIEFVRDARDVVPGTAAVAR